MVFGRFLLPFLAFLFVPLGAADQFQNHIDRNEIAQLVYTIEPVVKSEQPHLVIDLEIRLKQTAKKELTLMLPARDGNIKDLYREIGAVQLLTPGLTITDVTYEHAPSVLKLKTIGAISGDSVQLRYTVVPTTTDYTTITDKDFYGRPLITKTYLYAQGSGIFIVPIFVAEQNKNASIPVTVNWKNMPRRWTFASSFGLVRQDQTMLLNVLELNKTLFVGGDYKLTQKQRGEHTLCIAMRGKWDKKRLRGYKQLIQTAIETENAFWQDDSSPFYLVVVCPLSETGARGGVRLFNAFSLFWGSKQNVDTELKRLVYHEYFHNWNGGKILRQQPEELVYWFAEGFTDYYAYQLALRGKSLSFADYIKAYNKVLYRYYTSPVCTVGNEAIQHNFWNNYAIEMLPYQRGHILAHNWNAQIVRQSAGKHSLDTVMHDILGKAVTDNAVISAALFERACAPYLGTGVVSADIEKYITQGELIEPDPQAFGDCCSLQMVSMPLLDCGFDKHLSISRNEICGVVEGGNAYNAGLRDGQKILGYLSPLWGATAEPISLKIRDLDGTVKVVSYHPTSKGTVEVPQYILNGGQAAEKYTSDMCVPHAAYSLLDAPARATPAYVHKCLERLRNSPFATESHTGGRSFIACYDPSSGNIGVGVTFENDFPVELTEEERAKFKVVTGKDSKPTTTVYEYLWGQKPPKKELSVQECAERKALQEIYRRLDVLEDQCKRDFSKASPRQMPRYISIDECAQLIKNKKVLFLTGAGISYGTVPTQQQLEEKIGLDDKDAVVNDCIRRALHHPEEIAEALKWAYDPVVTAQPTPAHIALAQLANHLRAQIVTANFDLLHEKAGIVAYNAKMRPVYDDLSPAVAQQIGAIVCIGSRDDFSAVLGLYKKGNSAGTIIAINREIPDYVSEDDYVVLGDAQQLVPQLASLMVPD